MWLKGFLLIIIVLLFLGNIASGTAIRNIFKSGNFKVLPQVMPESSISVLMDCIKAGHVVSDISSFEKEIFYQLRKMSVEEIADLADVSEGLEFSIKKAANSCNSVVKFLDIVKSKRYTSTRIQRILLYSLLGITKKDMEVSKKVVPYVRVLGFNENGKTLLSKISRANPRLQVVTSVKRFEDECRNRNLKLMFSKDLWASDVFSLGYEFDSWGNLDYRCGVVKV